MDPATDWVVNNGYQALDFDGSDDLVTTNLLSLPNLHQFSFVAWAFVRGIGGGSFGRWVTKNDFNPFGLYTRNTNNGVILAINGSTAVTATATKAGNFTGSLWHIAATYSNGGLAAIYADGVLVASASATATLTSNTNPVILGNNAAQDRSFDGVMHDARFWSRQLTAQEIRTLYDGGPGYGLRPQRTRRYRHHFTPPPAPPTPKRGTTKRRQKTANLRDGLVGAWAPSVSGWGGNVLRDLSGQGNHGTLTNMDPATDWVVSGGKQALDFDGVDDGVVCANAGRMLSSAKQATFSAWFYKSNSGQASVDVIGSGQFALIWSNVSQIFYVYCVKAGQAGFPFPYIAYNKNLLAWNNFTVVYDGTEPAATRCKLYANGELLVLIENGGTVQDTLGQFTNLRLGQASPGASQIDDVRIYNRALSESEIRLLASERGIGLRPQRTRRYHAASSFSPAWVRRQSLIGSGVY